MCLILIRAIWVRSMRIKYGTMVNMNVEVFTYSPTLQVFHMSCSVWRWLNITISQNTTKKWVCETFFWDNLFLFFFDSYQSCAILQCHAVGASMEKTEPSPADCAVARSMNMTQSSNAAMDNPPICLIIYIGCVSIGYVYDSI